MTEKDGVRSDVTPDVMPDMMPDVKVVAIAMPDDDRDDA